MKLRGVVVRACPICGGAGERVRSGVVPLDLTCAACGWNYTSRAVRVILRHLTRLPIAWVLFGVAAACSSAPTTPGTSGDPDGLTVRESAAIVVQAACARQAECTPDAFRSRYASAEACEVDAVVRAAETAGARWETRSPCSRTHWEGCAAAMRATSCAAVERGEQPAACACAPGARRIGEATSL